MPKGRPHSLARMIETRYFSSIFNFFAMRSPWVHCTWLCDFQGTWHKKKKMQVYVGNTCMHLKSFDLVHPVLLARGNCVAHNPAHPIELPKDPLAAFETSPRSPFNGEFEGKGAASAARAREGLQMIIVVDRGTISALDKFDAWCDDLIIYNWTGVKDYEAPVTEEEDGGGDGSMLPDPSLVFTPTSLKGWTASMLGSWPGSVWVCLSLSWYLPAMIIA